MSIKLKNGDKITFDYINYKGNKAKRKVIFKSLYYGNTDYHNENCFLLEGFDLDKQAIRIFATPEITNLKVLKDGDL